MVESFKLAVQMLIADSAVIRDIGYKNTRKFSSFVGFGFVLFLFISFCGSQPKPVEMAFIYLSCILLVCFKEPLSSLLSGHRGFLKLSIQHQAFLLVFFSPFVSNSMFLTLKLN